MKKNDVFEVECRVKIVLTKDDIDGIMSSALTDRIKIYNTTGLKKSSEHHNESPEDFIHEIP